MTALQTQPRQMPEFQNMRVLGFDIGDKHIGVSVIEGDSGSLLFAGVLTPDAFVKYVEEVVRKPEEVLIIGIESFLLYPWAAKSQSWKEFKNIELIGISKYLLEQSGTPYIMIRPADSKAVYGKTRLKRLGYEILGDTNDHMRDALSVALYARDRRKERHKSIVGLH